MNTNRLCKWSLIAAFVAILFVSYRLLFVSELTTPNPFLHGGSGTSSQGQSTAGDGKTANGKPKKKTALDLIPNDLKQVAEKRVPKRNPSDMAEQKPDPEKQQGEEEEAKQEESTDLMYDDRPYDLPEDFDARVLSRQSPEGFLVISIVNRGHLEFLQNFYQSLIRIGLHKYLVVVCLDETMEQAAADLKLAWVPATHYIDVPNYSSQDGQTEKVFAHHDYNLLVNSKIDIVYNILQKYKKDVVFTDVDLVWLMPKILDNLKHLIRIGGYDFIMARDVWGELYNACTGFYMVRPTDFALQIMDTVRKSPSKQGTNDQIIFNNILGSLPVTDQRKFHMLPLEMYMNGEVYDYGIREDFGLKPWMFHANYRVGKKAKSDLLKKAGYWYLPE
jgi:hypothetical protein